MNTYFHSSFESITCEHELAGRIKEAFSFKPADIVRELGFKKSDILGYYELRPFRQSRPALEKAGPEEAR